MKKLMKIVSLFCMFLHKHLFVNASFMTSLAGGEDERVNKVVVRLDKAGELEDKVPENVWLDVVDTLKDNWTTQ